MIVRDLQQSVDRPTVRSSAPQPARWPLLTAILLLGVPALLYDVLESRLGAIRDKKPLPLRKPLPAMRRTDLGALRFVSSAPPLSPEAVEALGTKDYIIWNLEDTRRELNDPLRYVQLFVTYYTGGHNLVPHTPDVCYVQGGYAPSVPHETRSASLPTVTDDPVPLRLLTFDRKTKMGEVAVTVVYTFFCNGGFTASRNTIRLWTQAPTTRHAFFSKVEVTFGSSPDRRTLQPPAREICYEAAMDVLSVMLPVLRDEVWPDFQAAEQAAKSSA